MAASGEAPAKRRRRSAVLPEVVAAVLEDSSVSQLVGDVRVVGLRGHLRPPEAESNTDALAPSRREALLRALRRSPHCLQMQERDFDHLLKLHSLPRVLASDAPRRLYRRRNDELKTVIHWGQRKLLLSEIEFLTRFRADFRSTVVYAGAAPGTHIHFLAVLFPEVEWILVDPAEFKIQSSESPKVQVRQEFFTTQLAREICEATAGAHVLFVSDVRTDYAGVEDVKLVDDMVAEDMRRQQEWVQTLRPQHAMLKFRLPWARGKTEYLDGDIHLPVWGPPTTTEARLITSGSASRDYDHTAYEEQMFFFNTVTRVQRYKTPMVGHGLDESYDCAAEMHILEAFLRSLSDHQRRCLDATLGDPDGPPADQTLDPLLVRLFRQIGKTCSVQGRSRHLLSCLPTAAREKWYSAQQVDAENGASFDVGSEEAQLVLQQRALDAAAYTAQCISAETGAVVDAGRGEIPPVLQPQALDAAADLDAAALCRPAAGTSRRREPRICVSQ